MSMSKPCRALTLVSYVNNTLILQEDVLKKVLESEEAMNRPVAVISIAGMFRKGKSFFLNFILRYLKSKGDPNWIGSHNGPLIGFDWRPDDKGVTSGITIWPEVFVLNDTAVLLIDTQGLYESSKNTEEDTYIMVLSFLFSSIQILNHQENLNSSDLKNFEFFAKYGMALESKTTNIKGFQNLMFLIRDWKHEKKHAYGLKSGNDHLKDFLKTNISKELHSVRETLNHFKKVDCFLMPYPGETVARSEEFKGGIEQIERNFLDYMKAYDELPAPKSLIQLQMDILRSNAEKECLRTYNDAMSNGTKEKLLDNAEMGKLHKEFSEAAVEKFDDLPDFGNQDQMKTAKSKCSQIIDASEFKSAMEEKVKSHMHSLKRDAERECMTIYNDGMKQETKGKLLEKTQMEKLHKKFAAAALSVFDKIPIISGYKELIETARSQCSETIEASDYKSRMEVKHHVLRLKNNSEKECMTIYNDGMTKETNGKFLNNSEMDKLHEECASSVLKVFDKLPDLGYQEEIKDAKLQCLKMIEGCDYKKRMEEKVKTHMNMMQSNAEKECMNIYNNGMTKVIKEKLLSNLEMDNLHKEFASKALTKALKVFDNLTHFGNHGQLKNAKLECIKTIEASEFKSRMEEKVKSHMITELSNAEKECIMIFNRRMTNGTKGKLLNNAEMEKLHNECKSAALEVFDNLPDFGNRDQIKNAKFQCSKMIEASDYKSGMEEKVKSDMNTQQSNAENECMIIYNDEMKRGTEEKYLNKAKMDILHKCLAEALKVFDLFLDFGNKDQIKIAKAQCSKIKNASDFKSRMEEKLKMQGSTLITQAKFDCLENYNDNMRRVIRNKPLSNSEMDKEHMECVASALKLFDNLPNFVNTEEIRIAKSNCSQMMKTCEYRSVMEGKMKDKLQKILNQFKNNYTNSLKHHAKISEDIETFEEQASQCRNEAINDFKAKASFADTELIDEQLESLTLERNIAICYTNDSQISDAFGIIMTPMRGEIHRNGSINVKVYVPSSKNFTNIEYTVVGDINGIGPGLNHVDGNAPPSQAELKSGIGQLIAKIPATKDNKFYIKTLLRQHGNEICVNDFAFGHETEKLTTSTLDTRNEAETETGNSEKVEGFGEGTITFIVLASFVILGSVLGTVIHELRRIEEVFTCSKFRNSGKKMTVLKIMSLLFILPIAAAADYEFKMNYDIGHYKLLQVNQTLELICKNLLNRDPPSWRYSSRLHRDPRMKLSQDVGESSLVISNATVEDAGQYMCLIDHEYNGNTFHYNRTIEVIANEIKDVKVEEEKDSIKLLCDVHAYPSATVIWKIDYDNKKLNPLPEEPDEYDYWIPPGDEDKFVIHKSEGRWTLGPYKGVNNAELIIANVTENDNGKYYCVAKNLAGEQCKECNVTRSKRGVAVEGKSSTAGPRNGNVVETETENSQEVEGLGGGTITLIVLASFFALGCVLGASITLYRKKQHQKKEEKQKESQESRSLPLIERNGASKA